MSVIRAKFLQVAPDDLRYGYDGACLLALVRYVCSLKSEQNGRVQLGGETWWLTSQADIADSLSGHVSHDSIRRTVRKLEAAGKLLRRHVDPEDRRLAYRVANASELPLRDNAEPLSCHYAKSPDPDAKSRNPDAKSRNPRREIASCSSITEELSKELEELGERAPARPQAQIVDSGPDKYCQQHMPNGTDRGCHLCGAYAKEYARWLERNRPSGPDAKVAAWQRLKGPSAPIDADVLEFGSPAPSKRISAALPSSVDAEVIALGPPAAAGSCGGHGELTAVAERVRPEHPSREHQLAALAAMIAADGASVA